MKLLLLRLAVLTLITVSLVQQRLVVAQGDALQELSGAWRVVVAEFEGREDHQLVGSRWVFQGDQLRLQNPNKENGQFKVTLDPQTTPKALLLEPRGSNSAGQQAGWLIYTRQTDRLRLAFFDNLKARPQGFGPRENLAVLTLVPDRPNSAASAPARLCQVLRAANPSPLLGGLTEVLQLNATSPGASCGLQGMGGRVALAVVEAPGGVVYFEARLELSRRTTDQQTQLEQGLGGTAYSIHSAGRGRVDFVVLKKGSALAMVFDVSNTDPLVLRRFVRQVVALY